MNYSTSTTSPMGPMNFNPMTPSLNMNYPPVNSQAVLQTQVSAYIVNQQGLQQQVTLPANTRVNILGYTGGKYRKGGKQSKSKSRKNKKSNKRRSHSWGY